MLEDVGGVSLRAMVDEGPLDLETFFQITLPPIGTIGRIHDQGVIHKDINPNNILVNRDTADVRLVDFSISSRLAAEHRRDLQHPHLLKARSRRCRPSRRGG